MSKRNEKLKRLMDHPQLNLLEKPLKMMNNNKLERITFNLNLILTSIQKIIIYL